MALQINGFFPGELMPSATIAGCIDIFERAWPNPDITIKMAEESCQEADSDVCWTSAPTINQGQNQTSRTNKLLTITHLANLTNSYKLQNIHNQFNMLLLASTIPYVQRYKIRENLWHEPYGLLKYQEGEEYKQHYDGGTDTGRAVSALVYLNDDYVGGEIEFPNFGVKIKPQAGMLILFPSNYAYSHIAHPVINGTKYCLVTWLRDRDTTKFL
jgi:predicted 2-oxoglutarate/Fe(II)-dependent dioxygenase YbiX